MLSFDCTADINAATAFLSDLSVRHVPFAAARALNRTASLARDAVRSDMPQRFTLRRPWVAKGIGIERASKEDLNAVVFSRDAFMADQEYGANRSGATQIIPVGRMAEIHASRVIPKSQWPKAHYAKGKAVFYAGTLFQRRGKKLEALYLFRKKVRIAPRFGMTDTVHSVALRSFAQQFENSLHEALATAH